MQHALIDKKMKKMISKGNRIYIENSEMHNNHCCLCGSKYFYTSKVDLCIVARNAPEKYVPITLIFHEPEYSYGSYMEYHDEIEFRHAIRLCNMHLLIIKHPEVIEDG